jgi:hypothetical protein
MFSWTKYRHFWHGKQGDPYWRTLVQRTKRRVYVARTESNQYSRNP